MWRDREWYCDIHWPCGRFNWYHKNGGINNKTSINIKYTNCYSVVFSHLLITESHKEMMASCAYDFAYNNLQIPCPPSLLLSFSFLVIDFIQNHRILFISLENRCIHPFEYIKLMASHFIDKEPSHLPFVEKEIICLLFGYFFF